MNKDCERGLTVFCYPEKTIKSNRLHMTLKRQHSLVSFLKIRIEYWSGRGLKPPLPAHRCLSTWAYRVAVKFICISLSRESAPLSTEVRVSLLSSLQSTPECHFIFMDWVILIIVLKITCKKGKTFSEYASLTLISI